MGARQQICHPRVGTGGHSAVAVATFKVRTELLVYRFDTGGSKLFEDSLRRDNSPVDVKAETF